RFVRWERSPESVMRLGLRLVIRHGIRRVQVAEPMNDAAVALKVAEAAHQEGAEQIVAALTYTISPLHDDAFYTGRARVLGASPPSTERTLANLRGLGFSCRVEDQAVREMSAHFEEVRRRQNLPAGRPVEYDISYYEHQVPGGMMTTLTRQLAEVGLQGRLA